jgi:biotin synthase-like enzyme
MVGNYLTTLNRPVEQDLQMLKDLGLECGLRSSPRNTRNIRKG